MPNPLEYAFWADADPKAPVSYEALQTRRKIAESLMGKRSPFPKTAGEGLTYLGESIADRVQMAKLEEAANQHAIAERARFAAIPQGGGYVPAAAPGPTAAPAARAPAPAAPAPVADPNSFMGRPIRTERVAPARAAETPPPDVVAPTLDAGTPAGQDLSPQQDASRNVLAGLLTPYADPSFPEASEPAAPTPSQANVPLPPPRPVYDRNKQIAELQDNPDLQQRMQTIARGESADPREQQIVLETMFNRAGARGQPLSQITRQYTGPGSTGYYPASSFGRGQAPPELMTAVMRGSDTGGQALGFAPTGNASAGVADRGVASGRYGSAGRLPGSGETFVTQEPPAQLERLADTRLDARAPEPPPGAMAQLSGGVAPLSSDFMPAPMVPRTLGPATADPRAIPAAPPDIRAGAPPGTRPSQEVIPAAQEQVMEPPGPEPKRPGLLPPSPQMQHWDAIMRDPNVSDSGKAYAKSQYDAQVHYRNLLQTQQDEEHKNRRERWEKKTDEYDKFVRERVDRNIKQMGDRAGIEKTQAELEKMYFEQGLPRQQQVEKATLDIIEARRKVSEPHRFMAEGTEFQQQYDPKTGSYGPAAVTPGAPPPEKKALTMEQAKAVTFVRDVLPDMDLLESKLNHGMVLAQSPLSSLGSAIGGPVGLGNVLVTKEYQEAQNAIGRFKGAVMQHLSGAAVSPSEAERNLPAFIPRLGDTEEEVLRKSARRRNYVNAVAETAGSGGDAIERGRKLIMQANGELPPVHIKPSDKPENFGAGQRVILPDGREKVIPWPKHLLPK